MKYKSKTKYEKAFFVKKARWINVFPRTQVWEFKKVQVKNIVYNFLKHLVW